MTAYLRQNTAVRIVVGPFLDKSDGITPETALTVTGIHLMFIVENDDGSAPTTVLDTTPTASGGNNDMIHISGDDAGYYDLELTAANTNYVGRAKLALTDAANHLPVFHEYVILPQAVYDSIVAGSDYLQTDLVQWRGTQPNTLQSGRVDSYIGAVAAGVIAAASFAAGALDAVWSTATRVLTAGTNISLAKGSGITGFNDISTSDILAATFEGAETIQDYLRLSRAVLYGKASGMATTTATFRNAADDADRVVATVDANGNRSALTLDPDS